MESCNPIATNLLSTTVAKLLHILGGNIVVCCCCKICFNSFQESGHRQFQDVLRLNVDGSYIEGQNHAGCWGVVVRDNEGAVAAARAGRTDRVSSAFHAELLIACGAVDLALVWSGKNMPGAWRPSAICSCMYSAVYVWRILIGAHESTRDKVLKGSTRNTS